MSGMQVKRCNFLIVPFLVDFLTEFHNN
jgi:hypothetical protein